MSSGHSSSVLFQQDLNYHRNTVSIAVTNNELDVKAFFALHLLYLHYSETLQLKFVWLKS